MRFSRFAILFGLGTLSMGARAEAVLIDHVAAIVGDEPVLQSDVESRLALVKSSKAIANILRVDPNGLTQDAVALSLIEEKIIHVSAKEIDSAVSDTDLDNQIASIAKSNNLSRKQLESQLKSEGIDFDLYRGNIRNQLEKRNIFDRELRRSGGVSEAEMRDRYEQSAKVEVKLLVAQVSKAGAAKAAELVKSFASGKLSLGDLKESLDYESYDWNAPENLQPKLAKAVAPLQKGQGIGPIDVDKKSLVVVVEDSRRGSDEEFEKVKPEISAEIQAKDFEKRFDQWLQRRKRELLIVINKA